MPRLFDGQMDYVAFCHGFGFVLLAAVCLYLIKSGNRRLPWAWLGLFGISNGVCEWLSLAPVAPANGHLLSCLRLSMEILSFAFLAGFGLGGVAGDQRESLRSRVLLPLLLLTALGSLTGWSGVEAASRYSLALPGAILAGLSLFRCSKDSSGTTRRSLFAGSAAFAIYAIAAGVMVPKAAFPPASAINQDAFLSICRIPIQLVQSVAAVWIASAAWVYSQASRRRKANQAKSPATELAAVMCIIAILIAGWVVTDVVGRYGDVQGRNTLRSRTLTAASGINPEFVRKLTSTQKDLKNPTYWQLRSQLQAIHSANKDCRFVYLMSRHRGHAIFLVDAEPLSSDDYSPPGQIYEDASMQLNRTLVDGEFLVEGPLPDKWGTWVSGIVGIPRTRTGRVLAVLGMDVDAAEWLHTVARYRLFGIAVTLLLCILTATFFFVLQSMSESNARVAASEYRYRSLVENTSDWVWELDENLRVVYVSPRVRDVLGYEPEEAVGATLVDIIPPDELERFSERVEQIIVDREPLILFESTALHKNGSRVILETNGDPVFDERGMFCGYRGISRDVTRHRRAEAALRIQTSAINAASDQIIITDKQGNIEFVNPSFERETGHSFEEVVGKTPHLLSSGKHDADFYACMWDTILAGRTWHGEVINKRKDGNTTVEDMTITPVKNDSGAIEHFVAIKRNITEKKIYEQQLDHLAHHDPLTGLPNRPLFSDRLTQCLAHAAQDNRLLAVMFLDLDRFKLINDTLGHNVGDELLKTVAKRLKNSIRKTDTLARMGGDEFTLIVSDLDNAEDAAKLAGNILEAMSTPFDIGERELFVTASIGASLYPLHGTDVETLVRNADSAMYRAKEQGRNNYQIYTDELNATAIQRMNLESDLRKAIERQELVLHYQPQVDIETGEIRGAEALVRWRHPELGLVPPSRFIPLAEDTGLITAISDWVLYHACVQNKAWQDQGFDAMSIAVNISGRQFQQGDLAQVVEQTVKQTGLDPRHLELELTESSLMEDPDRAAGILGRLKEMGIRISVDDFGTGYSTLSQLKRFPVDAVKIDRSFVKDINTNADDAAIAGAVVAMAHSLNLIVTAEGAETLEQLHLLRSLGCDQVQGYFISRPVPPEEFRPFLRKLADLPAAA